MSESLVSVIIATFNRSNVLALAIESVRWQTLRNWELIVVGDACTDDTEQVVRRIAVGDERIQFVNLSQNVGEQSGPNNAGFQRARGRYIAYLNHDDLWLPDHLEHLIAGLEAGCADLAYSVVELIQPAGPHLLTRVLPVTRFPPPTSIPASCWLVRRELIEELGGWRFCQDCLSVPSRDLLFRAWRSGRKLLSVPRLSVVAIQSGLRKNAYSERQYEENHQFFERVAKEPDFRQTELAGLGYVDEQDAIQARRRQLSLWGQCWPPYLIPWRLFRRGVELLFFTCWIDPLGVVRCLYYRRRGGFIDFLRERRGLPPLPRRSPPAIP